MNIIRNKTITKIYLCEKCFKYKSTYLYISFEPINNFFNTTIRVKTLLLCKNCLKKINDNDLK